METQLINESYHSTVHAINIYNFPKEYPKHLYPQAIRYLFRKAAPQNSNQNGIRPVTLKVPYVPTTNALKLKVKACFMESIQIGDTKNSSEYLDIIWSYSPESREECTDIMRQAERMDEFKHTNNNERKNYIPKINLFNIYEDSQNVHNSTVNNSVIKAAITLCTIYKNVNTSEHVKLISAILSEKYGEKYNDTMKFIKENTWVHEDFTLRDLLKSVWCWMNDYSALNPTLYDDLLVRFTTELDDMNGKCTTGHISRLINVLQGFTQDSNLIIKISDKDQYKSVISYYLNGSLSECTDEAVHDEVTKFGPNFKRFVISKIKEILPVWEKEYGKEMITQIPDILNNFMGGKLFTI